MPFLADLVLILVFTSVFSLSSGLTPSLVPSPRSGPVSGLASGRIDLFGLRFNSSLFNRFSVTCLYRTWIFQFYLLSQQLELLRSLD